GSWHPWSSARCPPLSLLAGSVSPQTEIRCSWSDRLQRPASSLGGARYAAARHEHSSAPRGAVELSSSCLTCSHCKTLASERDGKVREISIQRTCSSFRAAVDLSSPTGERRALPSVPRHGLVLASLSGMQGRISRHTDRRHTVKLSPSRQVIIPKPLCEE